MKRTVQTVRYQTNETGLREFTEAGDVQQVARKIRAGYGFSTGSRTAFPHSVHDPS